MRPAEYVVIRYVPDPGRNEALNIGVIVWDSQEFRLSIDDDAVERVVRESPWLEKDALLYLEPALRQQIAPHADYYPGAVPAFLRAQPGFPVWMTEPRYTTVSNEGDGIDETLARLIARVVRPRRHRVIRQVNLSDLLERQLRPLLVQHRVTRNYPIHLTRSKVPRSVEFFANSGANVAVDTLRLNLKRADDIRLRADAQAFKVEDVGDKNVSRYVVLCEFSEEPEFSEVNANARRVLGYAGAEVVTDPESAANILVAVA